MRCEEQEQTALPTATDPHKQVNMKKEMVMTISFLFYQLLQVSVSIFMYSCVREDGVIAFGRM